MKSEEDKFGEHIIKPTSFYSSENEKTKLNWFCYELSLSIFDEIRGNLGKRLKKFEIDDAAIAELSIYLSKKIRNIILQKLSGKIKKIYFSHEMIELYFPDLSDRLAGKMLDIVTKAYDELLSVCEICPTRCISEKDAYCTMFDEGP